ncbi:LysE family translocator [Candidatus Chlorohelix sp.]|uniref:LysE family translocator n=1 Tax=Candidatus Chlorohelix sp. TaxID=3139201 RepID=UPI0030322CE8
MPELSTIFVFMAASLTLNLVPGPDMLYVIARSVGQSRRAGLVSALGIGGGIVVHTLLLACGLSALLISVPVAFEVVKYSGAAYLLYLGIKTLITKENLSLNKALPQEKLSRIFRQGVVTNVLNPKVALFFLAFLPQFTDPSKGSAFWQILFLGMLFNTSSTILYCGVAWIAAGASSFLNSRPGFTRAQRWFTGSVFILLGVRIVLSERS